MIDATPGNELLLFPHLGLGDALVCNAIVRHLAAKHALVVVLCKPHNAPTEAFMWRDLQNVEVFSVKDDDEAKAAVKSAKENKFATMGLGFWGEQPFDKVHWDREFYRQAGIDFQQRWNGFRVERQPSREIEVPKHLFCLIHEDKTRNCLLDRNRLPKLPILEIVPTSSGNLFDYWDLIEQATELHFMESSPAILADSLPCLKAKRKAIHMYTRNSIAPHYQNDWEIIT